MLSNETLEGDARLYRDVTVVGGRLKYVELQLHWKACSGDCYFSDGWMASTWSRPINCSCADEYRWRQDTKIMDSTDENVVRYFG
jgi:hypothetical protein